MRNLKFRAFLKSNRKMYDVLMLNIIDQKALIENAEGREYAKMSEIELIQYTGLKDRNGQEICEGDVLKAIDIELEDGFFIGGFAGYVEWDAPAFVFKSGRNGEYADPLNHTDEFDVIGNIFENPELLR
ncbi:MAG: YopX family protein [Peptostreptococcaceae bacterium]|nr:YopX family protein [Peptostreptococcaceae bacterium]